LSITLMPMNGTMTPPRPPHPAKVPPQAGRRPPTGRYVHPPPFRAMGISIGMMRGVEDGPPNRIADGGRAQVHEGQSPSIHGIVEANRGWHDGEILGQVIGDRESRQRARAVHQKLPCRPSTTLDQLWSGRCRGSTMFAPPPWRPGCPSFMATPNNRAWARAGGVIGAIPHHGHQLAALLLLANVSQLGPRVWASAM